MAKPTFRESVFFWLDPEEYYHILAYFMVAQDETWSFEAESDQQLHMSGHYQSWAGMSEILHNLMCF